MADFESEIVVPIGSFSLSAQFVFDLLPMQNSCAIVIEELINVKNLSFS